MTSFSSVLSTNLPAGSVSDIMSSITSSTTAKSETLDGMNCMTHDLYVLNLNIFSHNYLH